MLSNLPSIGGDIDAWGGELNAALTELENTKLEVGAVRSDAANDVRFVRTINGTAPDGTGNVVVSGGGGGGGVTSVDWNTQVTNRPTIPSTAAAVGAIPTTDKAALNGVATLGATGLIPIAQVPTGTTATTVALGNHVHAIPYDWLPAGMTIQWPLPAQAGQVLPRPTARTDLIVEWNLATSPPVGGTGAVVGVDKWVQTPT